MTNKTKWMILCHFDNDNNGNKFYINGNISTKNVSFKNVSFKNVSFKNVSFKNVSFKNVSFKNVSFKNVSFKNVSFKNVVIFVDNVCTYLGVGSTFEFSSKTAFLSFQSTISVKRNKKHVTYE